jgi:glycosyltransferase involved in cell wall biosynthesis
MADMVQAKKKIALLHRYPMDQIKETNAAFPYLVQPRLNPLSMKPGCVNYYGPGMDVLTFKKFDRINSIKKFFKSLFWIFYAPSLVIGKGYDTIYCDDSYPFYPALVKLVSPKSDVVIRLGDLHLMYYYSGFMYRVLHFIERLSWIMADRIIVISEAMAEYIHKEINVWPDVVLDPVDPKDFPNGSCFEEGTVMFHGVLTKNKNVDVLIKCAELLPQVDFIILGDGPDLNRLRNIAPENVYFHGWVPFNKIYSHIASCTVGVSLRSDNPGNEYVVTSPFLQYGVMGKPCLVTRRRVFKDYKWQFDGAIEMAVKLKKLLANPFEEGQKLKKFILENHDAEKIGEQIWHLLQS